MNGFVDRCDENKEKKNTNYLYPCAFLMKSLWELLFNQSLGNTRIKYKAKKIIF